MLFSKAWERSILSQPACWYYNSEITQIYTVCFLLSAAELKHVNTYGEVSE